MAQSTHRAGIVAPASTTAANTQGIRYHVCECYSHTYGLPDYKLLAQPRTNNYYAAVGGCPCVPRAAAHPGSWRIKAAHNATLNTQLRSRASASAIEAAQTSFPSSAAKKKPTADSGGPQKRLSTQRHTCPPAVPRPGPISGKGTASACGAPGSAQHSHQYTYFGWLPGPHRVNPKNIAAEGLCDTYGNMSFMSSAARGKARKDNANAGVVTEEQLNALEGLILQQHEARMNTEADVEELQRSKQQRESQWVEADRCDSSTSMTTSADDGDMRRSRAKGCSTRRRGPMDPAMALDELMNNVQWIANRPLNQTNIDLVQRLIQRNEAIQRMKETMAKKKRDSLQMSERKGGSQPDPDRRGESV